MRWVERFAAGAVLVGLLGPVAACDEDKADQTYQNRHAEEHRAAIEADQALLSNMTQADVEFRRRLRERLTTRDGTVIVREIYSANVATVSAFPVSTPWSVTCGPVGMSVTFGAGTSEAGGIVDLQISEVVLDVEQCSQLAPSLAREVAAALASGSPSPQSNAR